MTQKRHGKSKQEEEGGCNISSLEINSHVTFNFFFLFLPVPHHHAGGGWYPQRNTVRAGNKIEFPAYLFCQNVVGKLRLDLDEEGEEGGKKTLHQRLGGETFLPHKPVSLRRGKKPAFASFYLSFRLSSIPGSDKNNPIPVPDTVAFFKARGLRTYFTVAAIQSGTRRKRGRPNCQFLMPFPTALPPPPFLQAEERGKLCDAAAIF